MESIFYPIAGIPTSAPALRSRRAREMVELLGKPDRHLYVSLAQLIRQDDKDVLVIDVQVERPQEVAFPISRIERLAVTFDAAGDGQPCVFALRSDFPLAPHVNLSDHGRPRSLCLSDESWSIVKLSWTAANFLRRIRTWLADTAVGELHRAQQPLEPLLTQTHWTLILPKELLDEPGVSDLSLMGVEQKGERTLLASKSISAGSPKFVIVSLRLKPRHTGIILHNPNSLSELNVLLSDETPSFAATLADLIKKAKTDASLRNILTARPIFLLIIRKTRTPGGEVEETEARSFFCAQTLEQIGLAIDLLGKTGSNQTAFLVGASINLAGLETVPAMPVQVLAGLDRAFASRLNGVDASDLPCVAVGVGALGSQILGTLVRTGFGRWSLVDFDEFAPHNAVRHLLTPSSIGLKKGAALADHLNAFPWRPISDTLSVDVLVEAVEFLQTARIVCDFSASVAVSRHLAGLSDCARCVTAFITEGGEQLVLLREDDKRAIRLDWLEMLHYRQRLHRLEKGVATQTRAPTRYGNGCRDLSAILSQVDVALWSSIASRAIRLGLETPEASVLVWTRTEATGEVARSVVSIESTIVCHLGEWQFVYDRWLMSKLHEIRAGKLPRETGGILLGHFDTSRRVAYIVDALSAPSDSIESQTHFFRGSSQLQSAIREVESRTYGQLSYVGEWHSHPKGHSPRPSPDDWAAFRWLSGYMELDSYPAILGIVGSSSQCALMLKTPGSDYVKIEFRESLGDTLKSKVEYR